MRVYNELSIIAVHHYASHLTNPDRKVHGANMGPIRGRQDPGEPHVGPMNFAIWESIFPRQNGDNTAHGRVVQFG